MIADMKRAQKNCQEKKYNTSSKFTFYKPVRHSKYSNWAFWLTLQVIYSSRDNLFVCFTVSH